MLHDSEYDKIKVLKEMSSLLWFVKNHAIKEIAKHDHEHLLIYYKELEKDLERLVEKLELLMLK